MIHYKKGDLIREADQFDVIIHGCNCFCNFGAGIALQIKKRFPKAFEEDKKTVKGDRNKLGTVSVTDYYMGHEDGPFVVNAYTQYYYEKDVNADYDAIRKCMKKIKYYFSGLDIAMPLIGAGLANGDWNIIEKIINEELKDENVTVIIWEYDYNHLDRAADILEEC